MATEGLDNLLALGAGASASAVASEEVGAEEDPAARALALARALGHNKDYNDAGTMELVDTIARKLGGWRKALRGEGQKDLAWCRALVLLRLHERSFASLKEKEVTLTADGWEGRALLECAKDRAPRREGAQFGATGGKGTCRQSHGSEMRRQPSKGCTN